MSILSKIQNFSLGQIIGGIVVIVLVVFFLITGLVSLNFYNFQLNFDNAVNSEDLNNGLISLAGDLVKIKAAHQEVFLNDGVNNSLLDAKKSEVKADFDDAAKNLDKISAVKKVSNIDLGFVGNLKMSVAGLITANDAIFSNPANLASEGEFIKNINQTISDSEKNTKAIQAGYLKNVETLKWHLTLSIDLIVVVVVIFFIFLIIFAFVFTKSFRNFMQKYVDLIVTATDSLIDSASKTKKTAEDNLRISKDVAKGSVTQSTKADEFSKVLMNITASIEKMSAYSEEVAELVRKTEEVSKSAEESGSKSKSSLDEIESIVLKTDSISKKMADNSNKIDEIISTITNVADQTNLLALNAAIEAARAGDAGRGFAVVADEVRKLAETSKSSADNIKTLINEMIESVKETATATGSGVIKVKEGYDVINKSIGALNEISKSINTISTQVGNLTKNIHNQSENTVVINDTMNSILAVTEQNSASSQQLMASMEQQNEMNEGVFVAIEQLRALAQSINKLLNKK